MSVPVETSALYGRTIRASAGVAGSLLFVVLSGATAAHGFKSAATTRSAAKPDEVPAPCEKRLAPGVSRCSQEAARTITDSSCRTRYKGAAPDFAAPPPYIVDVALPSIYCENVNQWVFIYPARAGTQLYRLDPGKRESYRVIFSEAAKGTRTPWALRQSRSGEVTYFINMESARTKTFDYTVPARRFDVCLELAALPRVKIVSVEDIKACRQPGELADMVQPE